MAATHRKKLECVPYDFPYNFQWELFLTTDVLKWGNLGHLYHVPLASRMWVRNGHRAIVHASSRLWEDYIRNERRTASTPEVRLGLADGFKGIFWGPACNSGVMMLFCHNRQAPFHDDHGGIAFVCRCRTKNKFFHQDHSNIGHSLIDHQREAIVRKHES